MFFVSLASKAIDPEAYAWLVFTRATKMRLTGYNQRHTLVLTKGDIFGIRRTRSNTYQIVKSDALHVLYRNIPPNTHERIMANCIPYRGEPVTKQEVEDGFVRNRRVSTREPARKSIKRSDDYYIPPVKRIVEKFQIDQNNYQWRRLTKSNIRVVTKKQGKTKAVLHAGAIVGLRYRSAARGGYVLLDGNVRVHISHEMYVELVHASRILPDSQQKTAVVDLGSGLSEDEIKKLSAPKPRAPKKEQQPAEEDKEAPIPKLYDLEGMDEEDILEIKRQRQSKHKRNLRRMVRKLLDVKDQDVWVDNGEDFEDEDTPADSETRDLEDVDTDLAPPDEPELEDTEADIDEDSEEDVDADEDDAALDEEDDDLDDELGDAAFRDDEHVADLLEPGTVIKMKKGGGRKLVVIEAAPMDRNENLMEYILHDPNADEDDDDFHLFRLRLNVNMTLTKFEESAEILDEQFSEKALKSLQDTVEYADVKSVSLVK